jgi:hypothetical protein
MPMTRLQEGAHVCHGITWATGDPSLLLAPLPGGPLAYAQITDQRLGFKSEAGRWCTGRYGFADAVRVEAVSCPDRAPAESGGQCARCAARDEFRFAHQYHHGGHASDALITYMAQPHWLYLATFADGITKVGTAAEPRKRSRLNEQGALFATYLAKASDGRTVRYAEDALTRRLGLPQTVRAQAKLQALATLFDLSAASAAHDEVVARAADALSKKMNIPLSLEKWTPPAEGELLRDAGSSRVLYPHDLRAGEHGFTLVSCIGSQFLAVQEKDSEMSYVLDLGALKGCRITIGDFHSPGAAVQSSLF